ncbi:MAG: hypothetical protein AB4426_08765 [Xenococcaceae cyanobacterium]
MQATKFLDGLSSKLAERWFSTLFTPAFLFWTGGLLAIFGPKKFQSALTQFSSSSQNPLPVIVIALLVVTISASIIQRFEFTVLQLLEGYWPCWLRPLQQCFVRRQQNQFKQLNQRWQKLLNKGMDKLVPEERADFIRLDVQLMHYPGQADQLMPTRLGNLLRASELRPQEKYGLDAIICWPRLWLLLPESVQKDLTEARSELNTAARVWLWSILFLVWTIRGAWWPPLVTLLVGLFAYRWMLDAAGIYADLLEATFDLHRFKLYESLHWPFPANPAEERKCGAQLTAYLWRGSDQSQPEFTKPG